MSTKELNAHAFLTIIRALEAAQTFARRVHTLPDADRLGGQENYVIAQIDHALSAVRKVQDDMTFADLARVAVGAMHDFLSSAVDLHKLFGEALGKHYKPSPDQPVRHVELSGPLGALVMAAVLSSAKGAPRDMQDDPDSLEAFIKQFMDGHKESGNG